MFASLRVWFRQHGLIILVLVLGLLGSLVLVWWRVGFTLEFFQPQAAAPKEACTSDSECSFGCSPKGFCNACPSDSWCQSNKEQNSCEVWFCVGGGKNFNNCVLSNPGCEGPTTHLECDNNACQVFAGGGADRCSNDNDCGGGGGGDPTPANFSLRNVNWTPGGCDNASSFGGNAHGTVRVLNAGSVRTHIVWNIFRSDTAGCSATTERPSSGGSRSGKCDFEAGESGDCTLSYNIGANNCGRVQMDAAFSDGASGVFIGQVINYGVDCADVPPPTHLECQNEACVSVQGTGTNECSSNADCGITVLTHMVCQSNACVVVTGAGTNECAVNADCAPPETHLACQNEACVSVSGAGTNECAVNADCTATPTLVCAPSTQKAQLDQTASFTATGGDGTYAWTAPSGSPTAGQGSTFGTAYSADGAYTVTVTSGGQSAICGVVITTEQQELICTPLTQTVSVGQVANVAASGGGFGGGGRGGTRSYSWDAPSGNPSSGTGGTFGVSYNSAGTYQVTVSDQVIVSDLGIEETAVCTIVVPATETPPPTTMMGAPGLQLQKFVRNVTQNSAEVDTVSANPQDTVEFVIRVSSVGTTDVLDVQVRDTLPAGLTYLTGTTTLNNSTPLSDGIISGGVTIGDMSPGQTHIIRFQARVSDEGFFQFGTTTLVNTAYATASNAPEVSDVAFVTVTRVSENPALSLRKLGRNVSRNEIGERTSVASSPNETIEFTIRVQNVSNVEAVNVHVQDVVPQGVTYQAGTATLNGQPTSDTLAQAGVNIGTLAPGAEAIVRFLGRVVPANQLPEGTTTLINIARTWANNIPTLQAQLPIIITNEPIIIPPVDTGPGETTVLALIISAIVTLMYIGYTSTDAFRRREALDIARKPDGDFKGQ